MTELEELRIFKQRYLQMCSYLGLPYGLVMSPFREVKFPTVYTLRKEIDRTSDFPLGYGILNKRWDEQQIVEDAKQLCKENDVVYHGCRIESHWETDGNYLITVPLNIQAGDNWWYNVPKSQVPVGDMVYTLCVDYLLKD